MTLLKAVHAAQMDGECVTVVPVEAVDGSLFWCVMCEGEDHHSYTTASAAVDSAMLMAESREVSVFLGPEIVKHANSS